MSDFSSTSPLTWPSPFMQFLGLEIESIKDGVALLRLPLQPQFMNKSGFVHGGVLASLIDAAAAIAATSVVSDDEFVVTSDLNVAYLRSRKSDAIVCHSRVTWRGNTLIRAEAEVATDGEALARGFVSLMVRKYRNGTEPSRE